MSQAQEYAYTFRIIIPGSTHDHTEQIRADMVRLFAETQRPMIVSHSNDYMILSVQENTEFPDEGMLKARFAAKLALEECGVSRRDSVIIGAYATPRNNRQLLNIHLDVVMENTDGARRDMTDIMYHEELTKRC